MTFTSRIREHMQVCPTTMAADVDPRIMFLALALAGETGELANLLKKEWRDGHEPTRTVKIAEEMGDIYNYLQMLAVTIGVDLEYEAARKLEQFEQRPKNAHLFARKP